MENRTEPATPCGCSQRLSMSAQIPAELSLCGTPISNAPNANALADSLGVSPLYRQIDSVRWQNAAQVYQTSRAHSPVLPGARELGLLGSGSYSGTPLSSEDIAAMNRRRFRELDPQPRAGHLELEAIAAVHELSHCVNSISVSEILPRTADLIFVNVRTVDDHPYTLELTLKGWRIASLHTDSMNGDYTNVDQHTKYFENVKHVMDVISPGYDQQFGKCLCQRLEQLQECKESDEMPSSAENRHYCAV